MIQFAKVPKYTTSDAQEFDTLTEAQQHEIALLDIAGLDSGMAASIVARAAEFIAILKQAERKRASKKNGKKTRKSAASTENNQPK